ncbi:MAG: hypothetical protein Q9226_003008 [Calogaya cf. arnoldii]
MPEALRSLVSRRLSAVGEQLLVIWQRTWTSSQSIKQALTSPPSPESANFPTSKSDNGPAQETLLPVFNHSDFNTFDGVSKNADHLRLSSDHRIVQVAPSADSSKPTTEGPTTTTKHAESQTEDLRKESVDSGSMTDDTTHTYANAVTQTELPTPPTSEDADDMDNVELDDLSNKGSEAASHKEHDPEVGPSGHDDVCIESLKPPGGSTRVVVTKYDSEDCPALLITKEVIWRMEGISKEADRVLPLQTKVDRLQRKVNWDLLCVSDNEELLEHAASQDETDRLHEVIAGLRSKITPNEERLEALRYELVATKQTLAYLEGLFRDTFLEALIDTGLIINRRENTDDEAGEDEESPESQPDLYPDEVSSVQSDTSDISDISLEELHRRTVHEELRTTHLELLQAEHEFDMREENYDLTKARYLNMVREGECEMTPTEFDHCGVEATRELTKDLRLAAEAYEEALARRNALGPNDEDQESGFLDDQDDGYRLSWENEGVVLAPTALINKWLEDIPDAENIPDMAELEEDAGMHEQVEDCDIRSARMSDTYSCRDLTRNRRRIDRWRAMAGREK